MHSVVRSLAAAALLAAVVPAVAVAQKSESSLGKAAKEYNFEIRPTVGIVFPTSSDLDVGFDIGGSLRAKPPAWDIGLQLDFMYVDIGGSLFQATADVFWQWGSAEAKLHPYIIGGIGLYDGTFGLNAGIGADFAVPGAPVGFFAESRFHRVFTDPDDYGFIPVNVGVRLRF